eukprot:COSAG01_NODE_1066_length_11878_cov_244.494949_9_plen_137_part_00
MCHSCVSPSDREPSLLMSLEAACDTRRSQAGGGYHWVLSIVYSNRPRPTRGKKCIPAAAQSSHPASQPCSAISYRFLLESYAARETLSARKSLPIGRFTAATDSELGPISPFFPPSRFSAGFSEKPARVFSQLPRD